MLSLTFYIDTYDKQQVQSKKKNMKRSTRFTDRMELPIFSVNRIGDHCPDKNHLTNPPASELNNISNHNLHHKMSNCDSWHQNI